MRRGSATYTSRRRLHVGFPTAVSLPWATYEREVRLFWRIRILLWLSLLTVGWFTLRGFGLLTGALAALLVEGLMSYRMSNGCGAPVVRASKRDGSLPPTRRPQRQAVPSPSGYRPPADCLPAWNWSPPGGIRPRLDRMPLWVRIWYRTPFVDRYAYAWMWRHGGWDVLPPSRP